MFAAHAQISNLQQLKKEERNAYLFKISKEVVMNFSPLYYRQYREPEVSELQVFQDTENLPSSNTTVEADAKAKFNALKNDAEALKKISIGVQVNTLKDGAVVTVLHWTGVSSVDGDRIIPRNCSLVDETNHIYTAFYVSQIKAIVY